MTTAKNKNKRNVFELPILILMTLSVLYLMLDEQTVKTIGLVAVSLVGVAVTSVLVFFGYLGWLALRLKRARVTQAESEAEQARVMVVSAKEGDQVFISDPTEKRTFKPAHLSPGWLNGTPVSPTPEEVARYQEYRSRGRKIINHQAQLPDPVENGQTIEGEVTPRKSLVEFTPGWLSGIVNGFSNLHVCGPTQTGKTTLANYYMTLIMQRSPGTKLYLIDPKHYQKKNDYIIKPHFDKTNIMEGLITFNEILNQRQFGNDFDPVTANRIVFVIDEWDYIFGQFGRPAKTRLMDLMKMGQELRVTVLLIGQSPLSSDMGLSRSDLDNTHRIALAISGEKLIHSLPGTKEVKTIHWDEIRFLKAQSDHYEKLAKMKDPNSKFKLRYCSTLPMWGNLSVEVVPNLPSASPARQAPLPLPDEDKVIVEAFDQLEAINGRKSMNRLHHVLTGTQQNVNSNKASYYQATLKKYGRIP